MEFRVVCYAEAVWALEARAAHQGLLARQWEQARRGVLGVDTASPSGKMALLERLAEEKAQLVTSGQLMFTRSDIVRAELRVVLEELGWWRRRWAPVPAAASARGRRYGARSAVTVQGGLGAYDDDVHVMVPEDLAECLRRGAWHTSERARKALAKWYDVHGRGPAGLEDVPAPVRGLAAMAMALSMPDHHRMRLREELVAGCVTPGTILRQVVIRAGKGYEPPGHRV